MYHFKKGLAAILAGIIFYGCSSTSNPHPFTMDEFTPPNLEILPLASENPVFILPDFSKLNKSRSGPIVKEPFEAEKKQIDEPAKKVDEVIDQKNLDARRNPKESSFKNALVQYRYEENVVYSIYTAVGRITDMRFENGEQILSISAGDTVNWLIEHVSGSGRPHLLIKPVHSCLSTNLTVITDRRTYYLYLKSWKQTSMTGCEWVYPLDQFTIKLLKPRREQTVRPEDLYFGFELDSSCNDCQLPKSIYEDKKNGKMILVMPKSSVHASLPVLFSVDDKGNEETINYRVKEGPKFIIDGSFNKLVLKYPGSKDKDRKVFIYRSGHKPKKTFGSFFNTDK